MLHSLTVQMRKLRPQVDGVSGLLSSHSRSVVLRLKCPSEGSRVSALCCGAVDICLNINSVNCLWNVFGECPLQGLVCHQIIKLRFMSFFLSSNGVDHPLVS